MVSVSNERHRLCWKLSIVYVYILYPYLDTPVKNIPNMLNHSYSEGIFFGISSEFVLIFFLPVYQDMDIECVYMHNL